MQDPELNFEQAQNPKGFKQSAAVARKGGEIAGDAKKKLEAQTGRSVISREKALTIYLQPIKFNCAVFICTNNRHDSISYIQTINLYKSFDFSVTTRTSIIVSSLYILLTKRVAMWMCTVSLLFCLYLRFQNWKTICVWN
jgi:hypothetical protein